MSFDTRHYDQQLRLIQLQQLLQLRQELLQQQLELKLLMSFKNYNKKQLLLTTTTNVLCTRHYD